MKKTPLRRFFFHYNKHTKNMTVHFKGVCYPTKNLKCLVPCSSHYQKKQPRLVMRGWSRLINVTKTHIEIL